MAVIVTLLCEALILLAIWSLGRSTEVPKAAGELVSTFDTDDEPKPDEEKKQDEPKPTPQKPAQTAPQPHPQPAPVAPQPLPTTPPFIPISPKQMQQMDITPATKSPPAKPGAQTYGPPSTGSSSMDSKRVGTAPNGQPMYAAAWYRKPLQNELEGYLSTAEHPGHATIACKTAPDYRVEDCVLVDESPDHSNYGRAVLAAAWQFKVRPPRIGGREIIGAWVRILIYDQNGHSFLN